MQQDSLSEYGLFFEGIDHLQGDCLEGLVWELEDQIDRQDPERLARFFIGLGELSERAKEIVRICLDCPDELKIQILRKSHKWFNVLTKNDLRYYLNRQLDWKFNEIDRLFCEIEFFLRRGLT